jgi:hyperosmotically inducible protein
MFREYASRVNPPIHIIVERGRVALTGAERSEVEKRKAEHIARSTFGVFSVENRLQVGS